MATLQQIKQRFQGLKSQHSRFVVDALNETSEKQVNLVAGQLARGIKSDGTKSDFTYTPATIAMKKQRSGLASEVRWVTNYNTGESYLKMYMKANQGRVEFGTHTDKEAAIMDRMDGLAFRPTNESKTTYITENAMPVFVSKVRNFLKM